MSKIFYASTKGLPSNDGTPENPFDLQSALKSGNVPPGSLVYVHDDGIYNGQYSSDLIDVEVRPWQSQQVIIDGYVKTALAQDLSETDTTIHFSEDKGWIEGNWVLVDQENIYLGEKSADSLSFKCGRGYNGTSTPSHRAGTFCHRPTNILEIHGSDSTYYNFHVYHSYTKRVFENPEPVERSGEGIFLFGPRTKLINPITHDCGDGIFKSAAAVGSLIYHPLSFNNGCSTPRRGNGFGLYLQNGDPDQPTRIVAPVCFNNFSGGTKAFGMHGAVRGFKFEGGAIFNSGAPASFPGNPSGYGENERVANLFFGSGDSEMPLDALSVDNLCAYHPGGVLGINFAAGWSDVRNKRLSITNSRFMGGHVGFGVGYFEQALITGITTYSTKLEHPGPDEFVAAAGFDSLDGIEWNKNTYYDGHNVNDNGKSYNFGLTLTGKEVRNAPGGGRLAFDEPEWNGGKGWRQWTGFDRDSTYIHGRPSGTVIVTYPNEYEPGRATIVIENWDLRPSVNVDASAILPTGSYFEVRAVEDFFGEPVLTGSFDGKSLAIPMTGIKVAEPIGLSWTPKSTRPEFGVFIIRMVEPPKVRFSIDNSADFVKQHYADFLNREPDKAGLNFWVNNIESCGADANCREVKRVDTSAAFFLSIEFQQTGYLTYRTYLAAYGRRITFDEFISEQRKLGEGVVVGQSGWEDKLEENKRAFFLRISPDGSDVLRKAAETPSQSEFNKAFVLMQYFGYLRREPDESGDQFWLAKLNSFNGDFRAAEMVKAFIASGEYRQRFSI